DSALYAIIRATVKHSLGQFSIAPVLDFNRNPELDTPYEMQGNAGVKPTVEVDTNYNPFAEKSTSSFKPSRSIGGTAKPANWDTCTVIFLHLLMKFCHRADIRLKVNCHQKTFFPDKLVRKNNPIWSFKFIKNTLSAR